MKFGDAVLKTEISGLSLVPANADLAGAEIELVNIEEREKLLRHFLRDVEPRFDVIFLDCPPALGILTVNALVAARSVLIPAQCEYYAMEGLSRLIGSIDRIQQSLNPSLTIEGIVLTMYDARNTLARQVTDQIRHHFRDLVYQTTIPRNVTLAEAPSYGRPALLYAVDELAMKGRPAGGPKGFFVIRRKGDGAVERTTRSDYSGGESEQGLSPV